MPPIVHEVLRSPGQSLDAGTRAFMEPRFGHDFSQVRVHTDTQAAESARAVNALAFTVGHSIVFGAGHYAPRESAGKKLLAHELTHVRQQAGHTGDAASLRIGPVDGAYEREAEAAAGRVDGRNHSGPPAIAAPARGALAPAAGVLQRTPGENPRESLDALATVVFPRDAAARARAQEAINRFLQIPSGARLINNLWRHFCRSSQGCRSQITISFVDSLGPQDSDASGRFEPMRAGARRYLVFVLNRAPSPGGGMTLGGMWPGGSTRDIHFTHVEPESGMASTLHHEILHVWFVNTQTGALFPTGHGNVARGEIEQVFYDRVRSALGELDALENRLKAEREAAAAAAVPAPPPPRPSGPEPTPRPTTGPPLFGGEVSIHGGGGKAGGANAGVGIVGADLILNSIYSLRLGARGVYLTPDHLFAGGTVGRRWLQGPDGATPGGRVENPLFFDLEAGVLAEIPASSVPRITTGVAGIASIGIGQEFGTEGTRFFWRLGGFVVIGDKPVTPGTPGGPAAGGGVGPVAGGGTVGVGLRF